MDRDNNLNQNDLDFEKINATLADPSFANWYYHQVIDNVDCNNINFNVENFVKIINNYKVKKVFGKTSKIYVTKVHILS